jgi:nucleosome binding factor SPN SPT16 subunit
MGRLLAIAFHEAVSVERLDQLFRSETNQLFAATIAAHCRNCGRQFAVFFPNSEDPDNMDFLIAIEERIAADCKDGSHSAEISLARGSR